MIPLTSWGQCNRHAGARHSSKSAVDSPGIRFATSVRAVRLLPGETPQTGLQGKSGVLPRTKKVKGVQTVEFGHYEPKVLEGCDAIAVADATSGETIVWALGDRELPTFVETPGEERIDPTLRVEVEPNRPEQVLAVLDQVEQVMGRVSEAAQHYREQHRRT